MTSSQCPPHCRHRCRSGWPRRRRPPDPARPAREGLRGRRHRRRQRQGLGARPPVLAVGVQHRRGSPNPAPSPRLAGASWQGDADGDGPVRGLPQAAVRSPRDGNGDRDGREGLGHHPTGRGQGAQLGARDQALRACRLQRQRRDPTRLGEGGDRCVRHVDGPESFWVRAESWPRASSRMPGTLLTAFRTCLGAIALPTKAGRPSSSAPGIRPPMCSSSWPDWPNGILRHPSFGQPAART